MKNHAILRVITMIGLALSTIIPESAFTAQMPPQNTQVTYSQPTIKNKQRRKKRSNKVVGRKKVMRRVLAKKNKKKAHRQTKLILPPPQTITQSRVMPRRKKPLFRVGVRTIARKITTPAHKKAAHKKAAHKKAAHKKAAHKKAAHKKAARR